MPGRRQRRRFTQLTDFDRGMIIGLKTAGWSARRIARHVDRSDHTVRLCWEQWTRDGTATRRSGSGRTRRTTGREDRRIVRQARRDPTGTRSTIQADVAAPVCPRTISRRLAEANLRSQRPLRVLPLTPEHRRLRLQWCQARATWNATDWRRVVFSDECRFVMGTDDHRVRVWRSPGQRHNPDLAIERHTSPTAGIMVWGAIAYDSRSSLVVVRGSLTGQRYVDEILRPHVLPFLAGIPGALYQQDNARPHTARVAQDCLRHVPTLPWPARSPDMSPIEHVWDQLKRQLPPCRTIRDLEHTVQHVWASLPQDNIRRLFATMPDRIAACIAARGGATRY